MGLRTHEIQILGGILIPSTARAFDASKFRESADEASKIAEEFVRLLAFSAEDKDIRKFLKDEANKKFENDYDILVSKVLDVAIGKDKFKDKIAKSSPSGLAAGQRVLVKAIKNERLNISIPLI